MENMEVCRLFVNHIYPDQCQNCQVEATMECKLIVEDCKCKNFVPLNGEIGDVRKLK